MINQYADIAKYYDLLVTSPNYYNYELLAKSAYSIIGKGCQILDLGVGTGLLVEKFLEIDSTCEFTGVDFESSMLEIAQQRLGKRAKLIEADATTMNLNTTFDVAISNGGVWGILDLGDRWELRGHISGIESNRQGLSNLARHLKSDGLLLLYFQKPQENDKRTLPGGISYSQFFEEVERAESYHTLQKNYCFKKNGKVLVQAQGLTHRFNAELSQELLTEAGFDLQGKSDDEQFVVYKKRVD